MPTSCVHELLLALHLAARMANKSLEISRRLVAKLTRDDTMAGGKLPMGGERPLDEKEGDQE